MPVLPPASSLVLLIVGMPAYRAPCHGTTTALGSAKTPLSGGFTTTITIPAGGLPPAPARSRPPALAG